MNNFDLHKKAQYLSDTKSPYELARELLAEQEDNGKLRHLVERLKYCAAESQGWDWLSAEVNPDEYDASTNTFLIPEMEELYRMTKGFQNEI